MFLLGKFKEFLYDIGKFLVMFEKFYKFYEVVFIKFFELSELDISLLFFYYEEGTIFYRKYSIE